MLKSLSLYFFFLAACAQSAVGTEDTPPAPVSILAKTFMRKLANPTPNNPKSLFLSLQFISEPVLKNLQTSTGERYISHVTDENKYGDSTLLECEDEFNSIGVGKALIQGILPPLTILGYLPPSCFMENIQNEEDLETVKNLMSFRKYIETSLALFCHHSLKRLLLPREKAMWLHAIYEILTIYKGENKTTQGQRNYINAAAILSHVAHLTLNSPEFVCHQPDRARSFVKKIIPMIKPHIHADILKKIEAFA